MLRIHTKIFGLALVFAVGLFFVFPRVPIAKFFARMDVPISQMGFSDEIKPGDFARLARDSTPVFRAAFVSGQAPSYQGMYWKGATLSKIEGLGWQREKQGWAPEWKDISSKKEYVYEVDFSVLREDFIFLLPGTTSHQRLSPGRIVSKGGGTYRFYPRLQKKIRYQGIVAKARLRELSPKERKRYLSLPEKISPKVSAYVDEISSKFFRPQARVNAIMDKFGEGGFTYTLSPGALSGDYLEDFLFRSKKGYCEHFASAAGILLRMMGIPTRVVVGFHGGLWNPLGKYYILRNQDAHAWVEFWREGEGWQRVDPVEYVFPDRISQGVDIFERGIASEGGGERGKGFMARWKTLWFAVDMAYYRLGRSFFTLDLEAQKETLARLGVVGKIPLKMFLISGGIFALCGLFFLLVVKSGGRAGLLERYYSLLCGKLASLGMAKKISQGPRDYCQYFEHKEKNFEEIKSAFDDYILIKYAGEVERTPSFVQKVKVLKVGSR